MSPTRESAQTGTFVQTGTSDERVSAFVPAPLPPDPPIELDAFYPKIDRATQALGRLDGLTTLLPDSQLFLYFYVRKEALLSSQIEGTQSTLSDLLLFESNEHFDVPIGDVREVSNYVDAMEYGLARLRDGFPLSLRLVREIHALLLKDGRGQDKEPGEFRRSQNWFGGTRPGNAVFVPPPPDQVMACMGALEHFLHDETAPFPILVKAGLAHVQFETIHPFLDGNGRLGRLLVTFLLCANGLMNEPLLYLSLYLKANRETYYRLLQRVRFEGAWEAWLDFFLDGVISTANQAADSAQRTLSLFKEDREEINRIGRASGSALRVHDYLQQKPLVSISTTANALGLSTPTVTKSIEHLQRLGIVDEVTGRQRNRVYRYTRYFDILSEGTDPIPA